MKDSDWSHARDAGRLTALGDLLASAVENIADVSRKDRIRRELHVEHALRCATDWRAEVAAQRQRDASDALPGFGASASPVERVEGDRIAAQNQAFWASS